METSHYSLNARKLATWVVIVAAVAIVYLATAAAKDTPTASTTTPATTGQTAGTTATDDTSSASDDDSAASGSTGTTGTTSPSPVTPSAPSTATGSASGYKDGSFTTTASYRTPEGSENITVTLTLSGGNVTSSTLSQSGYDFKSQRYQSDFAASYQGVVVGQPISSLNLRRVSGASLTTTAFNNAVATIRTQAQS